MKQATRKSPESSIVRGSNEQLKLAFEKALTTETRKWLDGLMEQYDKRYTDAINDEHTGTELSRKFILAKTRGIILCDYSCMGAAIGAGLGAFYFGEISPYIGISHYSRSGANPQLVDRLQDSVVIAYIRFNGFELGFASCKNKDYNGEIILYRL